MLSRIPAPAEGLSEHTASLTVMAGMDLPDGPPRVTFRPEPDSLISTKYAGEVFRYVSL